MLSELILEHYRTVELGKVGTSLVSADAGQSNHHVSAAYHKLALLEKSSRRTESHGGGFIHCISSLVGRKSVSQAWAPPTTLGWSVVISPSTAPLTKANRHYFCSTFAPMPKSHKSLLDALAPGLCSPHSWLPFWQLPPDKRWWGEQEAMWAQSRDRRLWLWLCFWSSSFPNCILGTQTVLGMLEMEGKTCSFLFREQWAVYHL